MTTFIKGGRGKKAPYQTVMYRIPMPIKPAVELFAQVYRSTLQAEEAGLVADRLIEGVTKALNPDNAEPLPAPDKDDEDDEDDEDEDDYDEITDKEALRIQASRNLELINELRFYKRHLNEAEDELKALKDELQTLKAELQSKTNSTNSDSKLSKGLGQRALAKRLGCTYQWLTDKVILGGLDSWSKGEDPQGVSWELKDGKFYPCNLEVDKSAS